MLSFLQIPVRFAICNKVPSLWAYHQQQKILMLLLPPQCATASLGFGARKRQLRGSRDLQGGALSLACPTAASSTKCP